MTSDTRAEPVAPPTRAHRPWLRWAAWASVVANGLLVVTGGAVRLTGSGLGCPTWPECFEGAYTPHGALTVHAAIEFGNRMLTFALVVIALATVVAGVLELLRTRRVQPLVLTVVLLLAIPAQAVIGGITVLTDLNPWIVSLHLLVSLAMVCVSVRLVQVAERAAPPAVGGSLTVPGLAHLRRDLGRALRRHRGHRLGPARR